VTRLAKTIALHTGDVDPRVGTGAPGYTDRGRYRPWGFGSICLGPSQPHGSVQPGPDTSFGRTGGYAPGYPVRGFSQLHTSGTGGPGCYGDFLLSPQTGRCYPHADGHDSTITSTQNGTSSTTVPTRSIVRSPHGLISSAMIGS